MFGFFGTSSCTSEALVAMIRRHASTVTAYDVARRFRPIEKPSMKLRDYRLTALMFAAAAMRRGYSGGDRQGRR
jgi:hypothetical protein